MAVGEEGDEKLLYKVLLTYDGVAHARGYQADEIAFAGHEFVGLADVD